MAGLACKPVVLDAAIQEGSSLVLERLAVTHWEEKMRQERDAL